MSKRRIDGEPTEVPSQTPKGRPRQTLEEWAVDLCWVKACRDGFVSVEIAGYPTLFGCPQCDRAYTDRPGYTSCPSIKRLKGHVELYTPEEMYARQEDRKSVIEGLRQGRRGPRITGVESIGAEPAA